MCMRQSEQQTFSNVFLLYQIPRAICCFTEHKKSDCSVLMIRCFVYFRPLCSNPEYEKTFTQTDFLLVGSSLSTVNLRPTYRFLQVFNFRWFLRWPSAPGFPVPIFHFHDSLHLLVDMELPTSMGSKSGWWVNGQGSKAKELAGRLTSGQLPHWVLLLILIHIVQGVVLGSVFSDLVKYRRFPAFVCPTPPPGQLVSAILLSHEEWKCVNLPRKRHSKG